MRFFPHSLISLLATLALSPVALSERVIESSSLNTCKSGSSFTATLFNVAFTPSNNSISLSINGVSSISGNVTAQLEVIAYGFTALNETLDPCTMDISGFCPMTTGDIDITTNIDVSESDEKKIPGIAYSVPDLDGVVRVYVTQTTTGDVIACMEADLSNTKTVYQPAVGWATAIIAGLGLIASGITSGLGHTNTAAHVAANAVSLFGFFQAQAIIGMTAVAMPPIVEAWTQNFQWSMGIIRVGFLQSIATWYQRATGGTPTTYLSTLSTYSVEVQKRMARRSVKALGRRFAKRATPTLAYAGTAASRTLAARSTSTTTSTTDDNVTVRGIDRVGFRAGIEQTNIFMTGLIFFVAVLFFATLLVALTKFALDLAARMRWMKSDKFVEFRNGWKIVIKGILFRLVLLGFVQMSVLCLWELMARDSAAEIVLCLVVFISMVGALGWASWKVISLAKKSVTMHKNPAYILYSDPECLNKWGFLYVQYKATAYYFVVFLLAYTLCKAIFVAFVQSTPIAQAIGLVIVEAVALIGVSVLRPFMDKKTNVFNISIQVVNFLNAVFLLVFSDAFGQPEMVSGVMGVIFALYNVIFALVLLIMVFVSSIYAICAKNPDTRYQPMRDDRGSFIKSQQALTTELDALGATARGDGKTPYEASKFDDDESLSTDSLNKSPQDEKTAVPAAINATEPYRDYPSETTAAQGQRQLYSQGNDSDQSYGNSLTPPTPPAHGYQGGYAPQQSPRSATGGNAWQRGAGYN